MPTFDYDMGVLGGGAAGLTVASGSAQLGARTLLIEKEKELGGDCLHYGCVPSKTLIRTATVYHLMKNASAFGLPESPVPPVDFRGIRDRIRSVIAEIQKHDSVERFCGLGVRVKFGQAEFLDEHTVRLNGDRLTARTWVIATGSSAAVPEVEGLDKTPYITNREIFYLERLPATLAVLGAGPIAIEMAQAFARLGTRVTVIQRSAQILSREDEDMAAGVMKRLEADGVVFHLGCRLVRTNDLGSAREVTLENAAGKRLSVEAEQILVAMGRSPNLQGLGLEGLGIIPDEKGLRVDRHMRTSRKHIYAAGDVTGRYQFTHAAGYEGGIVVSNAIFHLPRRADYTFIPWCTYADPELASIGMNEKAARAAGVHVKVLVEEFHSNDRSLAEGEGTGRIKLVLDEKEKPLGVQILGLHAGELISEWVAALNGKVKLATLAAAVHPYPTLAEITKKVSGSLFSEKIFSDRVRKGLKLFFGFKGRACG